jgi:hypothetical protein
MDVLAANFRLAGKVGYAGGGGGNKYQGCTFIGVIASKPPTCVADFHGRNFAGLDIYILAPYNTGKATAPYTYLKSANGKDPAAIKAANQQGQPLTAWDDSEKKLLRCWSWTKVGFNRGARNEKLTWVYGGGDTWTIWIEPKDLEESEENGPSGKISLWLDGKEPVPSLKEFDLVLVCFMPKSTASFNLPKKTCFAMKGIAGCSRTLASYLPILKGNKNIAKSLQDAIQHAERTIREGKVCTLRHCTCSCTLCIHWNMF